MSIKRHNSKGSVRLSIIYYYRPSRIFKRCKNKAKFLRVLISLNSVSAFAAWYEICLPVALSHALHYMKPKCATRFVPVRRVSLLRRLLIFRSRGTRARHYARLAKRTMIKVVVVPRSFMKRDFLVDKRSVLRNNNLQLSWCYSELRDVFSSQKRGTFGFESRSSTIRGNFRFGFN